MRLDTRTSGFSISIVVLAVALMASMPVSARECHPQTVDKLVQLYDQSLLSDGSPPQPVTGLAPIADMAEARCVQDALIEKLSAQWGAPIGYKVGLTNPAVQKKFGVDAPVRGVLLRLMLYGDKNFKADYGTRPVWEPDLIAVVGNDEINNARTPAEVARHLTAIAPYIEFADLTVAAGEPLDGKIITAINVGARFGLRGSETKVAAEPGFVAALASMTVVVTDAAGKEVARAPGSAILGHPFNAVIWLADDLRAAGRRLKAGDVISLGAFAAPRPARSGETYTVQYQGFPGGTKALTVHFK